MNDETSHLPAALARAATLLHAPATTEETLDAIAHAALHTVPGFDHVGISITHLDGRIETLARTDQLVCDLDTIQYELKEGPCYDSIRGAGITIVEHARTDERWPRYMPRAAERGLRAQLAVGLYSDEQTIGGLNLYSTESDTVDRDAVLIAELFASHAALALGRSRQETQLTEAMASRKTIGQAIGILMERYELTEDRAFQFLIRTSQSGNIKLRTVAEELVTVTNEKNATT